MSHILPQISLKSIVSMSLAAGLLAAQLPLGVAAQAQAGPPVLNALSPSSATVGSRITIFGSGFTSFNTINYTGSFASGTSTAAFAAGDSMVTFIPSTLPSDTYQVTVSTTRGQTSNALPLQVFGTTPSPTPSPTPTISPTPSPTISPTPTPPPSGVFLSNITPQSTNTGQRIALFGGGFTSFNTINYAGSFASGTSVAASAIGTSVVTFVPATLPTDIYAVTFTTTRGQTSNALPLQVVGITPTPTPSPTPTISPTPSPTISPTPTPTPTPPPVRQYTALGDSLAVGAIAFRGYVPRYRDAIEQILSITVELDNLGRFGQTSTQLAASVQFDPLFRQSLSQADFITWNVGGNDLRAAREKYKKRTCGGPINQDCFEQTVEKFKTNWNIIVGEIIQLRKSNAVLIRSQDIYNPFVNEDKAVDTVASDGGNNDFDEIKPFVDEVNSHIAATLATNSIPFARVARVFNGLDGETDPQDLGFISFDGFHPNDAGHRVIAELLRQLGFGPLPLLQTTPAEAPVPVSIL